jgi:hypothetical protein
MPNEEESEETTEEVEDEDETEEEVEPQPEKIRLLNNEAKKHRLRAKELAQKLHAAEDKIAELQKQDGVFKELEQKVKTLTLRVAYNDLAHRVADHVPRRRLGQGRRRPEDGDGRRRHCGRGQGSQHRRDGDPEPSVDPIRWGRERRGAGGPCATPEISLSQREEAVQGRQPRRPGEAVSGTDGQADAAMMVL